MSSTLDKINECLQTLELPVYYGTAAGIGKAQSWNYVVFGRENATGNANLTSITHNYSVAIVHEDFVPEDVLGNVLKAMSTIPGMRWQGEAAFDYMAKPGTDDVVELMVVRFQKAEKLHGC